MSQSDSSEGKTQVRQFFWNRELFVKLGAVKSGTRWAASQNSNSAVGGSLFWREENMDLLKDSDIVNPLCKVFVAQVGFL